MSASPSYSVSLRLTNMWFKIMQSNSKATKQFHSALASSYSEKKAFSLIQRSPSDTKENGLLSIRNHLITLGQTQNKRLLSNDGPPSSFQDQNKKTFTCWNCGKKRDADKEIFFCFCGAILPPSDRSTYFDLLGMKQSFELDTELLTKKYKDLQRILHPDKFSQKSQREKFYSAEQSSLVNLAYTSLLKPLSRGLYMLSIYGESLNNGTQCEDVEFLMKIMETNENLEQVTNSESLRMIENLNTRNINQCYEILSEAFRQKDLAGAKEVVIKLKYFTTIDNKIREMELLEDS